MIEKISKIIHIADIHNRNFKRHKEYREVFKKTFKYIKSNKDEQTVIFLGGDIVHSKTDMTPELVDLTAYFLRSCADLCPTILICGNHDTNLSNQSRLDALTPLVESLNHPNLFYWKDSGLYYLGDICFSVYSVFGKPTEWIPAKDIDFKGTKIALHHGAVYGAKTDLDHSINNEYVKTDLFSGFDLVLLGDIHKRQFLNDSNTIHYCGSLIQQSHGETLEKGFTVWDVKNKTSEFIQIENEIGYVTLNVEFGKITNDKAYVQSWPKKLRLRIKYESSTKEQLQTIITALKSKHTIEEISISKNNLLDSFKNDTITLEDVRDIEYQNKLITEYMDIKNIHNVDADHLRHINRTINSELNSGIKLIRNIKWKPKVLEFSNMFSYGPGNLIDFTKLEGIQGIFATNASGKSSLLDIFTYCIYDKCSRAWKAKDVLNNQKTKFKCKLDLELNGELYTIERAGFKDNKKGNVKVEVDFFKFDLDGNKILLNGEDRDQTNKLIRDYLGTYDDFLLTTLSTQNDNKNFIFKTQKERKELLYSFLDLSVFDELQTIAKKAIKETSDSLIIAETEFYNSNPSEIQLNYNNVSKQLEQLQSQTVLTEQKINSLQIELDSLNKELIPIKETTIWDSTMESKLNQYIQKLIEIQKKITAYETAAEKIDFNIHQTSKSMQNFDGPSLHASVQKADRIKKEIAELGQSIKIIESKIESFHNRIAEFEHTKYNLDCDYCSQRQLEHINSISIAKKELNSSLVILKELTDKEISLLNQLESLSIDEVKYKEYEELQRHLNILNNEKGQGALKHLNDLKEQSQFNDAISKYRAIKDQYYTNQDTIEHNSAILKKKGSYESALITERENYSKAQKDIIDLSTQLQLIEAKQARQIELKDKIKELQHVVFAYNVYIEMMSNDGISYMILQKILPVIENEVNIILHEIVDFSVKFESDEKNNINCYLLYSDENIWPVEMASGMERFIVSLAIRIALVDITSLPRPIFMAIDEGFGVLDSDKISAMTLLFEYMRTKFDFVIAVSHVDTMRDMVDGLIDVHRNKNGFSEVTVV